MEKTEEQRRKLIKKTHKDRAVGVTQHKQLPVPYSTDGRDAQLSTTCHFTITIYLKPNANLQSRPY